MRFHEYEKRFGKIQEPQTSRLETKVHELQSTIDLLAEELTRVSAKSATPEPQKAPRRLKPSTTGSQKTRVNRRKRIHINGGGKKHLSPPANSRARGANNDVRISVKS